MTGETTIRTDGDSVVLGRLVLMVTEIRLDPRQ
jgi:hypothetical protein